jgi:hypothetical protein
MLLMRDNRSMIFFTPMELLVAEQSVGIRACRVVRRRRRSGTGAEATVRRIRGRGRGSGRLFVQRGRRRVVENGHLGYDRYDWQIFSLRSGGGVCLGLFCNFT